MKAIIIDDEKNGAEVLKLLLEQNCPSVKIEAVEYSPEDGIKAIQQYKPDVVFLDIEMPMSTGFDVIEATKQFNYEVIFTTAYEQYAIKALKVHAADYILKPIDVDELIEAVSKTEKRISDKKKTVPENFEELVLNVINKNRKISIPAQDGIILVDVADVIRLEAESNYTHFFLKDRKKITASKTLKSFEDQLLKNNFCRVHSAHLVNLAYVEKYVKGDGGMLILKDSTNIPVSRANKNELTEKLG